LGQYPRIPTSGSRMDVCLDVRSLKDNPAFQSPVRIGAFVILASHAGPDSLKFDVVPAALAERLNCSRAQLEDAITGLAQHGAIHLEKGATKRGTWAVDLAPSTGVLQGDWSDEAASEAPVRSLMKEWDIRFQSATGTPYMRTRSDYWRERNDWVSLHDLLGKRLHEAMTAYFADQEKARWGYRFSVFFRCAAMLVDKGSNEWRFR
jgi:hypothetical protein